MARVDAPIPVADPTLLGGVARRTAPPGAPLSPGAGGRHRRARRLVERATVDVLPHRADARLDRGIEGPPRPRPLLRHRLRGAAAGVAGRRPPAVPALL